MATTQAGRAHLDVVHVDRAGERWRQWLHTRAWVEHSPSAGTGTSEDSLSCRHDRCGWEKERANQLQLERPCQGGAGRLGHATKGMAQILTDFPRSLSLLCQAALDVLFQLAPVQGGRGAGCARCLSSASRRARARVSREAWSCRVARE